MIVLIYFLKSSEESFNIILVNMCKKTFLCVVILYSLLRLSDSKCTCGYGSYCDVVATNCLCEEISSGLYVTPESPTAECSEIKNHCLISPCINGGVCHPSFGSFYCVCPQGYHGHICDKYSSIYILLLHMNKYFFYL